MAALSVEAASGVTRDVVLFLRLKLSPQYGQVCALKPEATKHGWIGLMLIPPFGYVASQVSQRRRQATEPSK